MCVYIQLGEGGDVKQLYPSFLKKKTDLFPGLLSKYEILLLTEALPK